MRGAAQAFEARPGCVGATVLTASGAYFDLLAPETTPPDPGDIAHQLSRICRFGGSPRVHYSVAQHCVQASKIVAPEHAFAALMHDAHEAYIGDMTAPLKQLLPDYRALEKRVEAAVAGHFGLKTPWHPEVRRADLVMLVTEKRDVTPAAGHDWPGLDGIKPLFARIWPWEAAHARDAWLDRFYTLRQA
jgi:hypothetical protein